MIEWPGDTIVLIPAYKSAQLLEKLIPEILGHVPNNRIVVVDDGSSDGTDIVCTGSGVTLLSHAVNRGKGAALATGFRHITRDDSISWVITMDADGQHAPGDLEKFIAAARRTNHTGICIGARAMRPGHMPLERIVSNRLTSGILSLFCGFPVRDSQSGYRLYSTKFLRYIDITYSRFEMETEVILKAAFLGFPVTFIPIQTVYLKGPSHISHLADTCRWVAAVVRISLQKKTIIERQSVLTRETGS
jgi:glycosyltransferase involved in cell wall biosynthesis